MNKFNLQLFASSSDYWQRREKEALKNRIEDEKEYQKRIDKIYERMIRESTNEINAFYAKYASKEGISISEAKKRVSSVDIAEYEKKAKRYVEAAERDRQTKGKTDKNAFYFSDKANEEMRLYNATMKINRLEMLKANIGLELVKGHAELETFINGILKGRTEDELKRQAGILGKTVLSNNKKADAIVNGSFYNASFSERIWSNQALLKADLSKSLQSGLIRGKGARELARDLESRFNVSKSNAERLMITELARVQTEAQKQSFIRNGFEEYMFITNSGCCDICAAISGKHFKVKDMMPGENAPPTHPFCRCSTAAYEDSKEYEEWLDFLEKGGTTEQYNEFKKTGKNIPVNIEKDTKNSKISFREAKNIKEAEQYARDVLGIKTVSYKGADVKVANAMNKAFTNGINYCKKIKNNMHFVGVTQERNKMMKAELEAYYLNWLKKEYPHKSEEWQKTYAKKYASSVVGKVGSNNWATAFSGKSRTRDKELAAIVEKYSGIGVNSKVAKKGDDFLDSIIENVKIKYHPQGTESIQAVFDHEIGHQLDYALGLRENGEIQKLYYSHNKTELKEELSTYGASSIAEFIAEAYCEYINNPTPREIAAKVGEIIEKAVKNNE